jgi:hypothetical protein
MVLKPAEVLGGQGGQPGQGILTSKTFPTEFLANGFCAEPHHNIFQNFLLYTLTTLTTLNIVDKHKSFRGQGSFSLGSVTPDHGHPNRPWRRNVGSRDPQQ